MYSWVTVVLKCRIFETMEVFSALTAACSHGFFHGQFNKNRVDGVERVANIS